MYPAPQIAFNYLRYWLTASNGKGHGIHSPFVFDFVKKLLNDRSRYPAYREIEELRAGLRNDKTVLTVQDFGAGSAHARSDQRRVCDITRHAAKPAKWGQLLYRISRHYQPGIILELGTSMGVTSCYLALGNPAATLYTLEGAEAIAERARLNFEKNGIRNITQITGNFDQTLPDLLTKIMSPDLVFIDGNHRQEPTERYFSQLLPLMNNSILIFDDIHWSREMELAWKTIREHPDVRATIDLFFIGIVLFRQEFREKQHFTIRF